MIAARHSCSSLSIVFIALLLGAFSACSSHSTLTAGGGDMVKVGRGDLIQLTFKYHPALNQTLLVDDSGAVSFDNIGQLSVRGLTEPRLTRLLKNKYAETLATSELNVTVQKSSKFTIYLGGQIHRPGVLKFNRDLTVAQSIVLAGGVRGKANDCDVYVFRNLGDQGTKKFKVNLKGESASEPKSRFKLAPYDVVFVMKKGADNHKIGTEV